MHTRRAVKAGDNAEMVFRGNSSYVVRFISSTDIIVAIPGRLFLLCLALQIFFFSTILQTKSQQRIKGKGPTPVLYSW